MSSSIISYPNINKFIYFKGKFLLPNIDNNDASYFILTNTSDKYLLMNNDINNKNIDIEIFAVGGGGAGGYFYGNGGDGGTIIYKKLNIKKEEILELNVGQGAFYIRDNRFIQGFNLNIYEGGINDLFSTKNNYLMNMKQDDLITIGLKKKIERKISNLSNLHLLIHNDINSFIINNPINNNYNYNYNNNNNDDNNNNNENKWFNFNKGYTIEINSYLFVPYNSSIEIILEANKYGILFFYNDDDIKKGLFNKDLSNYNLNPNNNFTYWTKIENGKTTFIREGLKLNEKYYLKIIHSQDKELTLIENNLKIQIKLKKNTNENEKTFEEILFDDKYFKFNNSIENFGLVYSTPTTIFNTSSKEFIINASGGISGISNSPNRNFGNGGCMSYDINNKRIKICNDNSNGSTGIKLPSSISNDLKDLSYRYFTYGSGGGGSFWKISNYEGKGGKDAGNGISFTNIPSLSMPIVNTGGGGGGNSFITNITELMLKINKLSGADGIIIIKVKKNTEQTLIQTFTNMDIDELYRVNNKLELLYKTDKINIYNENNFINNLKLNIIEINNYGLTSAGLFIFFSILMNNLKIYLELNEKEKLQYPIKFIFNPLKEPFFVENNYYNFNFANYNETDFYFSILRTNIEIKGELSRIFNFYYNNNEILYNPLIPFSTNLKLSDNTYSAFYFRKIINEILNPKNLVLFIENVNKYFFNFFNFFMNFIFLSILYNLILNQNPNNDIIISKLRELIQILKNFNNIYFTPIDKNSNTETDTLIKDRTLYIQKQMEYKRIYEKNLAEMEKSNRITNYSINIFKTKYYQNKKNIWFDTLFYISIFIIIISFIISYNFMEDYNKPLIILVIFIILLIIILLVWNKSINDLKIFEKFGCNDNITSNFNNCLDLKGLLIKDNNLLPYYYLSSLNNVFEFKNNNDIIADIFVYGTPYNIKIDGIDRYYEPNVDIYKNILLPNTYSYKLYNNKIIASSPDNLDTIILENRIREDEITTNDLRIYNCNGRRTDICNLTYNSYPLTNKYTRYNNKKEILKEINTQPEIEDSSFRSHFDFIPDNKNNYYKFSIPYISQNVIMESFIIIKIINDMGASTDTLEETIHNFRKEMSVFQINVNLYLLNKNTKKIVDFTSRYHIDNQKEFNNEIDRNEYKYDRNMQAYNIISREIIINFYIKLLICLILIILLLCIFLFHYNPNDFPKILLLGLLLISCAMYLIFYNIFRHQRLDAYKYYYHEPEKQYINKIN